MNKCYAIIDNLKTGLKDTDLYCSSLTLETYRGRDFFESYKIIRVYDLEGPFKFSDIPVAVEDDYSYQPEIVVINKPMWLRFRLLLDSPRRINWFQ